jgi:hypothetical protein
VTQHTFIGVRLSVPTAFGILATGWPFAQISIGEAGVELIARCPLRSEWYSPLEEIALVKADGHCALFARADGSTSCFRFFRWNHDAIVNALVGCGLQIEHVDKIT